jgi:hypothetical protein
VNDIGRWCRRQYVDRVEQQTSWHLVESQIEDSVITKCGRQMQRVVHWKYPGVFHPLANHLEFRTPKPNPLSLVEGGLVCKRCDK